MDKLLQHQPHLLERKVKDMNGNLVDVDTGTNMVVTIRDGAGTIVVTGNATKTSIGVYQFTVTPANAAILDTSEVTWEWTQTYARRAFSYYEVVGGYFFTISEARAFRGAKLSDPARYPSQDIVNHREEIEEFIEHECGQAFVPRGRRVVLSGRSAELELNDWFVSQIYSLAIVDGATTTAYTPAQLADLVFGSRKLFHRDGTVFPWGTRNIEIHYAYGRPQVPEPIKRAGLILLQHRLTGSDIPDRTQSATDETGTMVFSAPGEDRPTGIPEVDVILKKWSVKGGMVSIPISAG